MMLCYGLLLTIFLTWSLQRTHATSPGYCTQRGNLYTVSNNDCSCFHQRDLSNGNEGYHRCPGDTTFNAAECVCDNRGPGNICRGSAANKCPGTGPVVITTNVGPGYCIQNNNKYTISSEDCKCFHQIDLTNGNQGIHRCADGLTFNPAVCVCDWPYNSKCRGSKSNTCPGDGEVPIEKPGFCIRRGNKYTISTRRCDCFRQEDMSNGNHGYHWCPYGLTFNPAVCVCDWPGNSRCKGTTSDYCPRTRD